MSSEATTCEILVSAPDQLFPVEILDSNYQVLSRAFGKLRLDVAPGIYLARCAVGRSTAEQLVKVTELEKQKAIDFTEADVALLPSGAPVVGSVSRHEFFAGPLSDLANRREAMVRLGDGARLTLFATNLDYAEAPHGLAPPPVSWEGILLLDQRGNRIWEAPPDADTVCSLGRTEATAAYTFDLDPGGYFVSWRAIERKNGQSYVQPIWIPSGWDLHLYAGAFGSISTPRPSTVSIHLVKRGHEIDLYEDDQRRAGSATEMALASLRTDRAQLSEKLLRKLLTRKFVDPMLGILGAHFLLGRGRKPALLKEVLNNLMDLVPDHPDVAALENLAAETFPEDFQPSDRVFNFPPMIRRSLVEICDSEWLDDHWLSRRVKGPARLARLRLADQGPWTFFLRHSSAKRQSFAIDEEEARTDAMLELADYLNGLPRNGPIMLRKDQFSWTGLSPADLVGSLQLDEQGNFWLGTIASKFMKLETVHDEYGFENRQEMINALQHLDTPGSLGSLAPELLEDIKNTIGIGKSPKDVARAFNVSLPLVWTLKSQIDLPALSERASKKKED